MDTDTGEYYFMEMNTRLQVCYARHTPFGSGSGGHAAAQLPQKLVATRERLRLGWVASCAPCRCLARDALCPWYMQLRRRGGRASSRLRARTGGAPGDGGRDGAGPGGMAVARGRGAAAAAAPGGAAAVGAHMRSSEVRPMKQSSWKKCVLLQCASLSAQQACAAQGTSKGKSQSSSSGCCAKVWAVAMDS